LKEELVKLFRSKERPYALLLICFHHRWLWSW